MQYDFTSLDKRIAEIAGRLTQELAGIRTGRAAPSILDNVLIESYGTRMPINQLANVSVEDSRILRIVPWDQSLGKEIERAITQANLGLSVGMDERGVRVFFPELTAERRSALLKLCKGRLEDARAHVRAARDETWSDIQKREREGSIPEDDKFRAKDDMQKRVDAANLSFDDMLARKEKELAG